MKYKCNCCGHEFESNEKNPRCPSCDCDDIDRISTFPWKIVSIIGGVVFLIIMIAILAGGGDDYDNTNIVPKKEATSLEVTISGPLSDKYQVELKRDSDNKKMSASTKKEEEKNSIKKVFKNLAFAEKEESYTLTVWCKEKDDDSHKHKFPKDKPFKKTYHFPKLDKMPTMPQITAVNQSPKRLSKKNETYIVTIVIDTACKDNVEYSIDNSKWQMDNVFRGLQPNSYTFYVRNTRDKNLVDSKSLTLDQFSPIPLPSKNQLNDWLSKVATGDEDSLDKLRNVIGSSSIKGVANISDGDGLINDAYIKGTVYRVDDMTVKDGVIESITIN